MPRFLTSARSPIRYILPLLAFLSPVLFILLYVLGGFPVNGTFFLSLVLGVCSYCYFMNALILSTRMRFPDRIYGHNRVMRFHVLMAAASLLSAILHRQLKTSLFQIENFQQMTLQMRFGTLALLIFLGITVITLLFMVENILHRFRIISLLRRFVTRRLGLDYNVLKNLHNVLVLGAIILVLHVLLASSARYAWSGIWLSIYGAPALLRWFFFKFIKPLQLRSHNTMVSDVTQLNDQVTEIRMKQKSPLQYQPGQFIFIRFPGSAAGREEHPFSLSSTPSEDGFSITAKHIGNYTAKLSQIQPGDSALVDGPYGAFTLNQAEGRDIVFIVGGIGITPVFSMLKSLPKDEKRSITLFRAVRYQDDLIYDQYIRRIAESGIQLRYIPVLSDDPPQKGQEGGFLSAGLIRKYVPAGSDPLYYFCGPPAMKKHLFREFKKLSISRRTVITEQFSLG